MIRRYAENKKHIWTYIFTELCPFENFDMELFPLNNSTYFFYLLSPNLVQI